MADADPSARTFIGRADELDHLRSLLRRVSTGSKAIVVVQGPAGIGKTTLVERALDECPKAVRIARIKCQQLNPPPYTPFISLCRQLRRTVADDGHKRGGLDEAIAILSGHVELRSDPMHDADSSRTRLFTMFVEQLENVLAPVPTVVLIDDAQWIDPASDALFEFIANDLLDVRSNAGLLFLVTTRTTGLGSTAWNPRGLRSRTDFERIDLGPLSESDRVQLVLALGLANPPSDVLRDVVRRSNGSPLYIAEAVAQYRSSAGRDYGGSAFDLAGLDTLVVTRADALSSEVQRLLSEAAALGGHFSTSELADVAQRDEQAVRRALSEAAAAGVVRAGGGDYEFDHDLWQDHFYHRLSAGDRELVHDRIAATRIASERAGTAWVMEVGHHLRRGGRRDHRSAMTFGIRAGDLAYAATAWSEAAENYAMALDAGLRLTIDPEDANELRLKAARAYERDMDIEAALSLYRELSAAGKELGAIEAWAAGVDGVMRLSTAFQVGALSGQLAPAPLIDFLEHVPDREDLRGRILTTWANLETTAGHVDEAATLAGEAVSSAERVDDRPALSAALFAQGFAGLFGLDLPTAADSFARSASLRNEPGLEWVYSECLTRLGWVHYLRGETDLAAGLAESGVRIAVESRHWSDASLGEAVLALVAFGR
ncbi:MAG: AAA family ATPase, partial [Acidimicrobiia bacterium]|nr:AAA family ATPase [Acidimicrobiia bacterium]